MKVLTKTEVYREQARKQGTYDIYIEIDTDCEELVDAVGLDFTRSEDDLHMNEIALHLTEKEFIDTFKHVNLVDEDYWNEVSITELLLNPEMCEYVTKVTIYKPTGDVICFY